MGMRFCFGYRSPLLPGETVLATVPWMPAVRFLSPPTFRYVVPVPPLWFARFFVTDRRALLATTMLWLLRQDFSQWFAGRADPADDEIITDVRIGRGRTAGSYLQITLLAPASQRLRSRELQLRVYMRDPELLSRLIRNAINGER